MDHLLELLGGRDGRAHLAALTGGSGLVLASQGAGPMGDRDPAEQLVELTDRALFSAVLPFGWQARARHLVLSVDGFVATSRAEAVLRQRVRDSRARWTRVRVVWSDPEGAPRVRLLAATSWDGRPVRRIALARRTFRQRVHTLQWPAPRPSAGLVVVSGSSGLGKTHLARRLLGPRATERSIEDWMNQIVYRLRHGAPVLDPAFRRPSRVLLDDVGSLAGRPATRSALATTVGWLLHHGRRVVLVQGSADGSLEALLDDLRPIVPGVWLEVVPPPRPARWSWARQEAARLGIRDRTAVASAVDVTPWNFRAARGALLRARVRRSLVG